MRKRIQIKEQALQRHSNDECFKSFVQQVISRIRNRTINDREPISLHSDNMRRALAFLSEIGAEILAMQVKDDSYYVFAQTGDKCIYIRN